MKINVIFYSLYGHNYKMAEAVSEGTRQPSENELEIARFQRRHVAEITKKLVGE